MTHLVIRLTATKHGTQTRECPFFEEAMDAWPLRGGDLSE